MKLIHPNSAISKIQWVHVGAWAILLGIVGSFLGAFALAELYNSLIPVGAWFIMMIYITCFATDNDIYNSP